MSYLGPDNMELATESPAVPDPYIILPTYAPSLKEGLLAKIEGYWIVQVSDVTGDFGEKMEVFDTDKEGTVLWHDVGEIDEAGARTYDLSEALHCGLKVKVTPR